MSSCDLRDRRRDHAGRPMATRLVQPRRRSEAHQGRPPPPRPLDRHRGVARHADDGLGVVMAAIPSDPNALLTPKQVSEWTQFEIKTLANMRCRKPFEITQLQSLAFLID